MGTCKLILEDCIEIMKEIPDKSIDFIFSDPPYGTTKCNWDTIIDIPSMWKEIKRIRKDNTATALFAQLPFDKILGMSNISELRYEWIWEKTQATGYFNAKKMPMKAHENILIFYKKSPKYYPIITDGHERKVSSAKARNACIERRVTNFGNDYLYGKETQCTDYDSTRRYPRDIIKFKKDVQKSALNRTQKPLELIKYILNTYCKEGDIVLDFCFGSNTTGLGCKELGLNYIGIEKNENQFLIGKNRVM